MKIGIPAALLYHRYSVLWEEFFKNLGCETVLSGETGQKIIDSGSRLCDGESCLPLKIFLGHCGELRGRCDLILVPRFERLGKNEEFCVRLWGLPDYVRSVFPKAPLLTYNLQKPGSELLGFLSMGRALGKNPAEILRAYNLGIRAQRRAEARGIKEQENLLQKPGIKVLLAARPYIAKDSWLGGRLSAILGELGAGAVYAHNCERRDCAKLSKTLSKDLYWTLNKEVIGAIPLLKDGLDGVILVSSFPCGTDSLVNELTLRRVRDIPLTHIVLDEHQGEAGLRTRLECFLDILERRRAGAS